MFCLILDPVTSRLLFIQSSFTTFGVFERWFFFLSLSFGYVCVTVGMSYRTLVVGGAFAKLRFLARDRAIFIANEQAISTEPMTRHEAPLLPESREGARSRH